MKHMSVARPQCINHVLFQPKQSLVKKMDLSFRENRVTYKIIDSPTNLELTKRCKQVLVLYDER